MEPTPEKRLSLEDWRNQIASKYGTFKDFEEAVYHLPDNEMALKYEALKSYHAQEVSFLQSQIPQYSEWIKIELFNCRLWVDSGLGWVYQDQEVSEKVLYEIYQESLPPTS